MRDFAFPLCFDLLSPTTAYPGSRLWNGVNSTGGPAPSPLDSSSACRLRAVPAPRGCLAVPAGQEDARPGRLFAAICSFRESPERRAAYLLGYWSHPSRGRWKGAGGAQERVLRSSISSFRSVAGVRVWSSLWSRLNRGLELVIK